MNNSTRARDSLVFTVTSTARQLLAAKPHNSAQRSANQKSLRHLASARYGSHGQRAQKLFLESEIRCFVQLKYGSQPYGERCLDRRTFYFSADGDMPGFVNAARSAFFNS